MITRINQLLRTNIALAALCIISAGVLFMVFHQSRQNNPSINLSSRADLNQAAVSVEKDALSRSPLRHMPAPSAFQSFTYHLGIGVATSVACTDQYQVIMVFSTSTDYRIDTLSAKYNNAATCTTGSSTIQYLPVEKMGLVEGEGYYLIRASEGKTGGWHSPY